MKQEIKRVICDGCSLAEDYNPKSFGDSQNHDWFHIEFTSPKGARIQKDFCGRHCAQKFFNNLRAKPGDNETDECDSPSIPLEDTMEAEIVALRGKLKKLVDQAQPIMPLNCPICGQLACRCFRRYRPPAVQERLGVDRYPPVVNSQTRPLDPSHPTY